MLTVIALDTKVTTFKYSIAADVLDYIKSNYVYDWAR